MLIADKLGYSITSTDCGTAEQDLFNAAVTVQEIDAAKAISYLQLGLNTHGHTASLGECAFDEPWISDPDVFQNIYAT